MFGLESFLFQISFFLLIMNSQWIRLCDSLFVFSSPDLLGIVFIWFFKSLAKIMQVLILQWTLTKPQGVQKIWDVKRQLQHIGLNFFIATTFCHSLDGWDQFWGHRCMSLVPNKFGWFHVFAQGRSSRICMQEVLTILCQEFYKFATLTTSRSCSLSLYITKQINNV